MRWVLLCGLMGAVAASAQDKPADPIGEKLAAAKKAYTESLDKSRAGLLATMKQREDAAKAAGDLKALEAIRDEVRAFEITGTLPKTVPTRAYESELRLAAAQWEDALVEARKAYTMADRIAEAKAADRELTALKDGKSGGVMVAAPEKDKEWAAGTVWTGIYISEDNGSKISRNLLGRVTKRDGKKFYGQLEIDFQAGYTVLDFEGVIDAAGKGEFKYTRLSKTTDGFRKGSLGQNIVGLKGTLVVEGKLAIGKYLHAIAGRPTVPPRVVTFELKRK